MVKLAAMLLFGTCITEICSAQTAFNLGVRLQPPNSQNWTIPFDSNFFEFDQYLSGNTASPMDLAIADSHKSEGSVACSLSCASLAENFSGLVAWGVGTDVSPNNTANIRYVTNRYNWLQAPSADLTVAGAHTVTLVPCPLGIDTSNNATYPYYVYITAKGTPEAARVTGGTCTGGADSGTLALTTANSHAAGYTIGSASSGIAEASIDAGNNTSTGGNGQTLVLMPAGTSSGPTTNAYYFYAPVHFKYSPISIEGSGALLVLSNPTAIFFNQRLSNLSIRDARVASNTTYGGAAITTTACASSVATITTSLNPPVGSWVDIQFTFRSHYWGVHQVVASSPTSWTYADANCGGSGTIASAASGGDNAPEATFLHDNGIYNTYVDNVYFDKPGSLSGRLNNGIVVYNNQGIHINNTAYDSGMQCLSTYCGSAVYAPGPFTPNAAVIWLDNDNFSMNCGGNAVTDYSGNDLKINGSVLQGVNMWAVNAGNIRGGFGSSSLTALHIEPGSCPNPMFGNQFASTGILNHGNPTTYSGGTSPTGVSPVFATGGATTFYYYVVVHDSVLGASQPLYAGSAKPSGNALTVNWFRVQGTNTVTYDVIRTEDANNYPTTTECTGGSAGACGSVIVAQRQCSANLCSFADNVSNATTAYTVVNYPGFLPNLFYWPGSVVLSARFDTAFSSFGANDPGTITIAGINVADTLANAGNIVTVAGLTIPSVISLDNSVTRSVGAWVTSASTMPVGLSGQNTMGATLFSDGFPNAGMGNGLKGRLNFLGSDGGILSHGHILTLVDSKQAKTKAVLGYRPSADAADTSICLDNASGSANTAQLCLTAPVSISNYINTMPDGSSYFERLTSSLKVFRVPVRLTPTTFSSLPACAPNMEGTQAAVNDSKTDTWGGVITGKGSNHVLAYCDGANWTVAGR